MNLQVVEPQQQQIDENRKISKELSLQVQTRNWKKNIRPYKFGATSKAYPVQTGF